MSDWLKRPILPNVWQYSVFHSLLIVGVAFQTLFEDVFFVFDALGYHRDIKKHNEEGEGRCQYKGHCQKENGGRHIHRMPDNAIEAGVDDFLILLDFDGSGEVSILP